MLIEFSVANFKSVRKQQTLSLVRAKGDELADTNTFDIAAPNRLQLLRSAAIYGPNAAGKSNLLRALRAMQEVMVDSASWQRGDTIPVTPFRLDAETESAPSEFEVVFIAGGVRYQYGFSATVERIHEEWLLAYPKGRAQRWFQRTWNETEQTYTWETGDALQGEKQLWQRSTRSNALFLSTAVQLNSEQLQPVYDWFSETLWVINLGALDSDLSATLCETTTKSEVINFLRAADLYIEDVSIQKEKLSSKLITKNMNDDATNYFLSVLGDTVSFKVTTLHQRVDGKNVPFNLEDESDGTKKLFAFAGPWVDTLKKGRVLLIDELHDNLHPNLVKFLVNLFHNSKTNPQNAQLIFTTHETSILNQEIFRRDQIWFCERDEAQASKLYPLTDFSPRKGRENLEAAYLSGRYGALPFVREMAEM